MAEHALGGEDDERLAPRPHDLAAKQMEVLRGGRGLADLHVVIGAELEVTLHTSGGVLRALTLVAMGKEHDDAGEQPPLGFAGGDELVNDDLRAVGEVAELCLPEDEGFGVIAGEAVLKAEDARFREERVVDLEARLRVREVLEREELALGFDVDHDGVALVEGATLGVLTGEADGRSLLEEGGEGDELSHAVVEGALAGSHFGALLEELFDFGVDVEVCRVADEALNEGVDAVGGEAGFDEVGGLELAAMVGRPVVGQL